MEKIRTLGVEVTMGALRQIETGGSILACGKHKHLDTFRAEIETLSCWQDYGQYNENRIHLLQNGEETPIKIGDWEFYPVVKDVHYWQLSNASYNNHTVTINGRDNNGKLFEATIKFDGDELPGIIYAMILLSAVNDLELSKEYWHALNGWPSMEYKPLGEHLDKVVALQKTSKSIINDHPYMESFLQQGLDKVVSKLKESLNTLEILK